ncbi:uncharacterized protein LOC112171288 [Rosa chinensis]|uniref:uncharacterized protein LOC112171288 n=1 Tax=Rosa chinensis TaxID=74649 RepID=UPI000D08D833|nr:uncharacterized protein LOC112171288 [Rosa chinensis]
MKEEISGTLGVEVVASHEKYLGLATYVGRKKTSTFHYIKERLAKKLSAWQGKLLSGAWKDILIRVVAQALPTYAMSVFRLTKISVMIWNKCVQDFGGVAHWINRRFIGKLGMMFSDEEAEAIMAIPLSHRNVVDRLVWKLSQDGKFSVKTAYRYAFAHSSSFCPLPLPVGSAFWKKECQFTKLVVQTNAVLQQVCYNPQIEHGDVLSWLTRCAQALSLTQFGELLFLLWGVWKERNDMVWNQKRRQAGDVCLGLISRLQEFRFHNSKPSRNRSASLRAVRWVAPPAGFLKINVDGAFHHQTRVGGLGFVIRNEWGTLLAGGACPLRGLISPEHAEVLACQHALEFAQNYGFAPAILETDAMEVQRQLMACSSTNTSALGRIYEDVGVLLDFQPGLQVCYVGRSGNMVVHQLATRACGLGEAQFYFTAPKFLIAAVIADLCIV